MWDISCEACNPRPQAQRARFMPVLLPTPLLHACQLLPVGITSSSSTRSIPCSIRSRRWRRHCRGEHHQSAIFSQGREAGASEVRSATLCVTNRWSIEGGVGAGSRRHATDQSPMTPPPRIETCGSACMLILLEL